MIGIPNMTTSVLHVGKPFEPDALHDPPGVNYSFSHYREDVHYCGDVWCMFCLYKHICMFAYQPAYYFHYNYYDWYCCFFHWHGYDHCFGSLCKIVTRYLIQHWMKLVY